MPEPAWDAFAGVVGFLVVALVGLARLSAAAVTGGGPAGPGAAGPGAAREESAAADAAGSDDPGRERGSDPGREWDSDSGAATDGEFGVESMSPGVLLANVALTQGLFGAVLVLAAWLARVPPATLGLGPGSAGPAVLALGVGLGVALYLGDEGLATVARRAGVGYSEALREGLAPDSRPGWLALLGVALPVVAGFEELLFRGVLVGAMAAGFGVSPWLLALVSSLLFGVAHGAQGPAGVVVTGLLGFALAAAFVLTGSLLVVVVAHYLVNLLEFVVHEWPGVEFRTD